MNFKVNVKIKRNCSIIYPPFLVFQFEIYFDVFFSPVISKMDQMEFDDNFYSTSSNSRRRSQPSHRTDSNGFPPTNGKLVNSLFIYILKVME